MASGARRVRRGFATAAVLLASLLAACSQADRDALQRRVDEVGNQLKLAWQQAQPRIQEGLRDLGKTIGEVVEAAGELLQKGGEDLQKEARDTTASTLPDTLTPDTTAAR